ncbi:MAG: hypothetical protein P4K80_06810 [Acidobacteriaceae bacterium]|nr:hypothetical protein [Acidobacteriaceae bacterium]
MRLNRNNDFNSNGSAEAALNQKVKNLIQKLGEAIHESVSESENIAGVVKDIREQGFDVLLMLEATIGLNEVEAEADEVTEADSEVVSGPFTSHDLSFLKSLRITLPDSEESAKDIDIGPPSDSPADPSSEE